MFLLTKPRLVCLEDRTAPALYHWKYDGESGRSWSNAENWEVLTGPATWRAATTPPQPADAVLFDGAVSQARCYVFSEVYIRHVEITNGYAGEIILFKPLHITSSDATLTEPGLILDSPAAVISGDVNSAGQSTGRGKLFIGANDSRPAIMGWKGGKIRNVDISVSGLSTTAGTPSKAMVFGTYERGANLPMGELAYPEFTNSVFYVSGTLNWVKGDVHSASDDAESVIVVETTGKFEIDAENYGPQGPTWHGARVQNHGLTVVSTPGKATITNSYLSNGTTRIKSGTLIHSGKTEQTAGVYELWAGATSKVTGADGLRIYDGAIIGIGTVDGNLKLGATPTEVAAGAHNGNPNVSPFFMGITGPIVVGPGPVFPKTIGTMTITGDFDMLSDNATMSIAIPKGGISKIDVKGKASLMGKLGLTIDQTITGAVGDKLKFLTTGKGISGDFAVKNASPWALWILGVPVATWKFEKDANDYYLLAYVLVNIYPGGLHPFIFPVIPPPPPPSP